MAEDKTKVKDGNFRNLGFVEEISDTARKHGLLIVCFDHTDGTGRDQQFTTALQQQDRNE